jgi:hypothetical protein
MNSGIDVSFSNVSSLMPDSYWTGLSMANKIDLVRENVKSFSSNIDIEIVEVNKGGQISIIINDTLSASERGTFMLDLEEFFKLNLNNGVTLWHAPIGDKSSLRNLRGIEVLS